MTEYELCKIAEDLDEDAIDYADLELSELQSAKSSSDDFKSNYLEYYDDIKLTPHDDW